MKNTIRTIWLAGLLGVPLLASAGFGGCNLGGGGGDGDGDTDSDTDSDTDADGTTIYDIQQGNVPEGTTVALTAVVATTPLNLDRSAIFVQEQAGGPWSGIFVYMYSEVLATHGPSLQPGAVLNLTGEYTEFYGMSEITVKAPLDLEVVDAVDVPAPAVVDAAEVATGGDLSSSYESVLVRVEDAAVTDPDLGYGEFEVDGALRVDDWFFDTAGGPSPNPLYPISGSGFEALQGVMYFTYEEYKLLPRFEQDYVGYSAGAGTSIYDIRQGLVDEGSTVFVSGAVVTTPLHGEDQALLIQDPAGGAFSGIYLYLWDEAFAAADLEPGDVVDVTAEYVEFYGLSELVVKDAGDLVVTGTGVVPEPVVVAAADVATGGELAEAYESVLVRIEECEVTDPALGYGAFELDSALVVDDWFFTEGGGPSGTHLAPFLGDTFTAVIGPLTHSYNESILVPRSMADFVGHSQNTTQTTIFDVQQGDVDPGEVVTIQGAVVTTPVHEAAGYVFVQDAAGGPWSGIVLYLYSQVIDAVDLEPGDVITVTGTYEEFYDQSQIKVTSATNIQVTGSAAVPAPAVVAPADIATGGSQTESYEGVLVEVQGVTVTNTSLGYGEFLVTGDLRVDDFFFSEGNGPSGPKPAVAVGNTFASLRGVMTYNFAEFKLLPRTGADFVE
jgi:DNA/RNA endonuclease YhcR with UshA esterase domain